MPQVHNVLVSARFPHNFNDLSLGFKAGEQGKSVREWQAALLIYLSICLLITLVIRPATDLFLNHVVRRKEHCRVQVALYSHLTTHSLSAPRHIH